MRKNPDYLQRVNRAIDHILTHLDQAPGLDELAKVACFSSFHFHRVFKMTTGETVNEFVKRVRLERAMFLLAHGKQASLTQIALDCGFASSSDFSRSFKQRYGIPPSLMDVTTFRESRRREMQRLLLPEQERYRLQRLPPGHNPDGFEPRLRQLPPRTIAYRRVHRPYQGDGVTRAARELTAWAEVRGVADGQWLGYQWDDPEIVPLDKCRYDVGVEVPDSFRPEAEVGRLDLPGLLVAELELDGSLDLEMRALDFVFGTWLPSSGYVPAAQPCFEAWHGRPFADGHERFRLNVQLPVTAA